MFTCLFYSQYVLNGEIHAPVFKGKPDAEMIDSLQQTSPEDVFKQRKWDNSTKYVSSST